MKFDGKIRELGPVSHKKLKEAILNCREEAWLLDKQRQERFRNVHSQTQSIVMLLCHGWPQIQIVKEAGWDYMASAAIPLMDEIVTKHYQPGGTVIRAMIAKLPPKGVIKRHFDNHQSFNISHRIHVPLKTHKDVEFEVDGDILYLKEGQSYELNNILKHQVENKSDQDRIHFIFDYVPPQQQNI